MDANLDDCTNTAGPANVIALSLVADGGLPDYCEGVFSGPEFEELVAKIPDVTFDEFTTLAGDAFTQQDAQRLYARLHRSERKLLRALLNVTAVHRCARYEFTGGGTVHAQYDPGTRAITIFSGACTASDVYSHSVAKYVVGYKYALVFGHEFGHALDLTIRGSLPTCSAADFASKPDCRAAEERATYFGTFFSLCYGRAMREQMKRELSIRRDAPASEELQSRRCIDRRWSSVERDLLALRAELKPYTSVGGRAPIPRASTLQSVMGCVGEMPSGYLNGIDLERVGTRP